MTRDGFTLVEVLVASVVAAMVVSMAAALMSAATDAVEISLERSESAARSANAQRWIQDVLTGMSVANTPADRFEGGPQSVEFRSSYRVAAGWVESARVALQYDGSRLMGTVPLQNDPVVLADSLRSAEFDYLLAIGGTSPWLSAWTSGATRPVALRMRLQRSSGSADTLVFYVGEQR